MKIRILVTALLFVLQLCKTQAADLPIDTLNSSDMSKPVVVYISGDGGFNSFSKKFIKEWNAKGFPVVALDAKSYFRETKKPEDAANDVSGLITEYLALWKRKEVILIGYSFGADVVPFIQTRLKPGILNRLRHTVLFSPSKNTDFTVHLFYSDGGSSVPLEINKLDKPVLVVFGDEETDLADKQINNKHATIIKVAGDHHYNNKIDVLVNDVVSRL